MIRVGVVGATGKMGRIVCGAVMDDPELELVAAIGRRGAGSAIGALIGRAERSPLVSDRRETLLDAKTEVAVDFTHPDVVMPNARWYAAHRIATVIGTSGLGAADVEELRELAAPKQWNVMVGPDFSLGGAVMLHLAKIAAQHFPEFELLEVHLPSKADAPSGTSSNTARELAKVRRPPASRSHEKVPGSLGGEIDGIRVHSLRLSGVIGHEEIRFAQPGETLTISSTWHDRSAAVPGVLLAIRSVVSRPGLTYGLGSLLDLADGAETRR